MLVFNGSLVLHIYLFVLQIVSEKVVTNPKSNPAIESQVFGTRHCLGMKVSPECDEHIKTITCTYCRGNQWYLSHSIAFSRKSTVSTVSMHGSSLTVHVMAKCPFARHLRTEHFRTQRGWIDLHQHCISSSTRNSWTWNWLKNHEQIREFLWLSQMVGLKNT